MDFPVEATVHLNKFHDETQVLKILRSHGFETEDLGGGQVRVKGRFSKFKDTKAKLDQLFRAQTKVSSSVPAASSGAVPKNYSHRDTAPRASPSSPTASSSLHGRPTSSLDRREVSFVVDADVFRYADLFKNKDISTILTNHGVEMKREERGDVFNLTLKGRSLNTAMAKLQSLVEHLSKSLRTQEVPLKDVNRNGKELLEKIRQNGNVVGSVMVSQMTDRLHLVGSSSESYDLKQRLLGRTVQMSGRARRTSAKSSRERNSSVPPINRNSMEAAADPNPSPGGPAGYSPSKYQDGEREDAASRQEPAADHSRTRSQSLSRENKDAKRVNGNTREKESKLSSEISPRKLLGRLIPTNIKQKIKKK